MTHTAKKIHEVLLRAKNILIVSHKNPDGDTLSSACALMQHLRNCGKNHTAFCASGLNRHLAFLPHLEYFVNDPRLFEKEQFDAVVVLDSGDLLYAGVDQYLGGRRFNRVLINIDHHPTNEFYGNYNLVCPQAASTTEVLYRFFKINNVKIDKYLATCLLTGLATDTAHFSNPATTADSLKTAAELLRLGANLNLIRNWTLKNKSLAALKIWGKILGRLQKNEKLKWAFAVITREDLKDNNLSDEETEGLANFLNNLNEADVIFLLREKEGGIIKVSLRTSKPEIDLGKIAKIFGGGGHAKAAGFSVKGKLAETKEGWKII